MIDTETRLRWNAEDGKPPEQLTCTFDTPDADRLIELAYCGATESHVDTRPDDIALVKRCAGEVATAKASGMNFNQGEGI